MTVQKDKIVYYSRGMAHFGEKMVNEMGFRRYTINDIKSDVFFQGLYFEDDYLAFARHEGKRTLYWNGNDVIRMMQNPNWRAIILNRDAIHLCHSYWQKEVLRRIGLEIKIHPIFFGDMKKYPVSYKHSDNPQCYMTSHNGRGEEYGVFQVLKVAPLVPEVTFHIFGQDGADTDNVKFRGWMDEDIMDAEIKNYQCCIKGGSNGIAITLMKSILLGQYPISYEKIDGIWHAPNIRAFAQKLKLLKTMKKPNRELRKQYINHFKPYG